MRIRNGIRGMALALLAVISVPVAAQDGAEAEGSRPDRAIQITPYVWLSGFGGEIRPVAGGPTFRVRRPFGELLDDLDGAVFMTGYARFDRLVLTADFSRTVSSREGLLPTGNPAAPVVPAEGRLAQTSLTLLGGVRAVDVGGVAVDLLAGVRSWWIDTRLDVPALGVARSPDYDFVDPIAAGRMNIGLGDGWNLILYGDFGGLGVGSDFTTQVAATVNARIARQVWLSGGYRYLNVDYREAGTVVNVNMGGPVFGLTLAF